MALVKELEQAGGLAKVQVSDNSVDALIVQTGAGDPASVRLVVRENRKLTPDGVAEVVASYQAEASIRSLGKTFGMHKQTVRAHLRRQGVTVRPVRTLTESQEDEAERLHVEADVDPGRTGQTSSGLVLRQGCDRCWFAEA